MVWIPPLASTLITNFMIFWSPKSPHTGEALNSITGHFHLASVIFFPPKPTLSLTLWHRLPPQCFLLLSQGKKKERKKKSVCFALKIDLWLVLFHSICRTLSLSSERWRAVHLLCLLCWVGGGWGCNSPDFRACKALSFVYFGSFSVLRLSTLSSLSIFLQHNGAGVVKLLQARNQI